MIFITVGTHEQQFNRLIQYVDNIKVQKNINEEIIIQTGFSDYHVQNCKNKKFFTYDEMKKYMEEARIVITHGGPSSFLMPMQIGKVPIVVPRLKKYDEHVNDHQLEFVQEVTKKYDSFIPVFDIESLFDTIKNYDQIIKNKSSVISNNQKFNERFSKIVEELFVD